ncbi:preprotein translocase subunit SecB [Palleronia aestuarii]|uniref:Protein-export protein SecB n=1 Tax=Palleronia aestuarii TaxID=568105 RepID=A0A2W7NFI0_9RHOB|nr:protein-export chaperone SecB [Palleronia aestuarii]PZX18978.1 preprotein translocase subunit SecB [Palleronia aestuarii]
MADSETKTAATPNGSVPPTPQLRPLGQYIRDLSFENIVARKPISGEVKPDVSVQVSLDAKKRGDNDQYEIIGKFTITSKNKESDDTLFVMELEYGGVFATSNVPNEQLHPFLLIEGPRQMFPFIRRIVADVTHDGGFPALNLEPIDFVSLYRQGIAQRQAAAQKSEETPSA